MLHTTPDAAEVLVAVREFLEQDVVPLDDPGLSFHARVAARLLRTLERELAEEPDAAGSLATLLADHGVPDESGLSDRIRAGDLTAGTPGLLDGLRAVTLRRLAVWDPTFTSGPTDDDPRDAPEEPS